MAITPQHEKGEPTEADLQHAYDKARSIGLFLVEKYAREVMREDLTLHEFIMGMGVAMFEGYEDDTIDVWDYEDTVESAWATKLAQLFSEWDDTFKFTGEPMRFTADGPARREW